MLQNYSYISLNIRHLPMSRAIFLSIIFVIQWSGKRVWEGKFHSQSKAGYVCSSDFWVMSHQSLGRVCSVKPRREGLINFTKKSLGCCDIGWIIFTRKFEYDTQKDWDLRVFYSAASAILATKKELQQHWLFDCAAMDYFCFACPQT